MKRIIALLLSLVMILGLLPTFVLAAEEEEDKGENLAHKAVITASSTLWNPQYPNNYDPEKTIDGNLRTAWIRANYAQNEWICYDLGQQYRITSVVLHFRLDQTADVWRQNVVLDFSNTPDFAVKERVRVVGDEASPYGEPVEVVDPSSKTYRYVRALKTDVNQFVLAEIGIYGYIPDPNAVSFELGDDVEGSRQEGPIKLLSYLGLASNEDEDNFGVDNLLTRGQAAKMVSEAFGGRTDFSGQLPFKDVDTSHRNYQDILNAYKLGYILGDNDSSFRPDDFVTKKELLIMTLRGIGYNNEVAELIFGDNMSRLLMQAEKLDLLKDVPTKNYDEPVSRGDAAVIFYNALLAPEFSITGSTKESLVYEESENMLKTRHNITLYKGIVEENRFSTLNGVQKTNESNAKISGTSFDDRSGTLDGYLGKSVIVAVSNDSPTGIILAWETDENEEVVLHSSSLVTNQADLNANRIVALDENDNEKKYSLDSNFYVVRNGVAHPFYTADELMSPTGQLRLLNNDDDRAFDVVFIEDYSVHYLIEAFTDSEDLTLLDTNGINTVVDAASVKIGASDGTSAKASKLKEDMLVKVFNTPDGKNVRIVYYSEPLSGKVKSKSSDTIDIDGTVYPLSVFYQNSTKTYEARLGDSVMFFVDEHGEVLWIESDASADTDWVIAFSQACGVETKAFDKTVRFKLFTEKGAWQTLQTAEKIKVDGALLTVSELAEKISADELKTSPVFEKEMLRYKLNSAGQISAIDTVEESETETSGDVITFTKMEKSLYELAVATGYSASCYTPESEGFWSQHQQILPAKKDTITFVIPKVNGSFTTDVNYDSLYRINTIVDEAGNRSNNAHSNLHAYMQDENGYPACFTATQNYSEGAAGSASAITSITAPFFLVEEASMTMLNDELVYQFTGWSITNQSKVTLYAKEDLEAIETGLLYQNNPDCLSSQYNLVDMAVFANLSEEERAEYTCSVSDIGFGDIIRYQSQGTTIGAMERVFDYNMSAEPVFGDDRSGDSWYTTGNNPSLHRGDYRFQFGEFSKIATDAFKIKNPLGHESTYKKSAFQKILVCDTNGRTSSITDVKELYQYVGSDYRVMTYSYIGAPRVMVIYKY